MTERTKTRLVAGAWELHKDGSKRLFSTLRGLGVFELFDVSSSEKHEELQALVETIVRACLPSPVDVPAVKSKARQARKVAALD